MSDDKDQMKNEVSDDMTNELSDDMTMDDECQEHADASADSGAEDDEDKENARQAARVLKAVEMLIDSDEKIMAVAKKKKCRVLMDADDKDELPLGEKTLFMRTGAEIIAHYAKRASLSGGVSGLPAMLPGVGSLIGFVGAAALDLVYMLKFEVEMSLCLFHLAGFDIAQERIRKLAITIVTVASNDVLKTKKKEVDMAALIGAAFWDYSVRQLSRHLLTTISRILVISVSRQFVRALPLVGVVVGATVNKVMINRTGNACVDALWLHRNQIEAYQPKDGEPGADNSDTVYDAEFLDE